MAWYKRMYPYLFALEETLPVTVGDVQRESQDPRSVLHALNLIIQSSSARALHTHRHRYTWSQVWNEVQLNSFRLWPDMPLKVCKMPPRKKGRQTNNEDLSISLCSHHVDTCESGPMGHLGLFVRTGFFPLCKKPEAAGCTIWNSCV